MKTYRAIRHDIVRQRQKNNADDAHHPKEKMQQIKQYLDNKHNLRILELFCGQGNLSALYEEHGDLERYDKKLQTGDSFRVFHELISKGKIYDVVDLDPYGFPSRFFPDVFLLIDNGLLFLTFPKPHVNILNGITQTHLYCYYGAQNPTLEQIQEKIAQYGLCHWRKVCFYDVVDLGRLWRMVIHVEKIRATEYTGTINAPIKTTNNNKQCTQLSLWQQKDKTT